VGEFWEENAGGDIIMRADEASFEGLSPEVLARFTGAATGRVHTMADVQASNESSEALSEASPQDDEAGAEASADSCASGGEGGADGTGAAPRNGPVGGEVAGPGAAADGVSSRELQQQTALLFMRRPPGSFVFCGRLEAMGGGNGGVGGSGGDEGKDGLTLRLVDTAPLRTCGTFHQLIGCRLLPDVTALEA
jgi:hypothetical protein